MKIAKRNRRRNVETFTGDVDGKKYKLITKGIQTASNNIQLVIQEMPEKIAISFDDVPNGVFVFRSGESTVSDRVSLMDDNFRRNPHKLRFSDKWNVWRGGECPLPEGVMVEYETRSGKSDTRGVETVSWISYGTHSDIIAWRFIRLADGYCYPDEVES